jgi:hypothetical protein
VANLAAASDPRPVRHSLIALKSGKIYAVSRYNVLLEVDWRATSELNSVAGSSATSTGQAWRERWPRLASSKRALAALPL